MARKKDETKEATVVDFITPVFGIDGKSTVETTAVEMTVYTALQKRKLYMKQLDDLRTKTSERNVFKYVYYCNQKATTIDGMSVEEFGNTLKSNYDKNVAILTNFHNINAAIQQSNATTKIQIGNVTYTVAEAIARYVHITEEIEFLNKIITECATIQSKLNTFNNEKLAPERIEAYVNQVIASLPQIIAESVGSVDTIEELKEKYRTKYVEDNTMIAIDPYNHIAKIKERAAALEEFKENFNEAINVCNLQTMIKVNLVN